ncbi:hypothetical protein ABIB94_003061 [Bradyrhizobium sp. JR7.2]|jgi:hypothetical protein
MQRLSLPPSEAFERHQNLTMVHQTVANAIVDAVAHSMKRAVQ